MQATVLAQMLVSDLQPHLLACLTDALGQGYVGGQEFDSEKLESFIETHLRPAVSDAFLAGRAQGKGRAKLSNVQHKEQQKKVPPLAVNVKEGGGDSSSSSSKRPSSPRGKFMLSPRRRQSKPPVPLQPRDYSHLLCVGYLGLRPRKGRGKPKSRWLELDEVGGCLRLFDSEGGKKLEVWPVLDVETDVSQDALMIHINADYYHFQGIDKSKKTIKEWHEAIAEACKYDPVDMNSDEVPDMIANSIQVIREKGLNIEGIFRISGDSKIIAQVVKDWFRDKRTGLDELRALDVHDVSGSLKKLLRELENPLLTFELYDAFLMASREQNIDKKITLLRHAIDVALPPGYRAILVEILLLCNKVIEKVSVNKMNAENLAIVFGPTIIRAKEQSLQDQLKDMSEITKLVIFLIENYATRIAIVTEQVHSEFAAALQKGTLAIRQKKGSLRTAHESFNTLSLPRRSRARAAVELPRVSEASSPRGADGGGGGGGGGGGADEDASADSPGSSPAPPENADSATDFNYQPPE